ESTPAIDATLVAPAGALRLIGVHLRAPTDPRSAAERDRQLDALAALVARIDGPLVVAGDFNLTPYSPYFEDLVDATGLRDSRTGSGPGFTWPSFFPLLGVPIDHCLVSPDVHVAALRRLSAFGSDHYPIVVELALSAPDRETLPRRRSGRRDTARSRIRRAHRRRRCGLQKEEEVPWVVGHFRASRAPHRPI